MTSPIYDFDALIEKRDLFDDLSLIEGITFDLFTTTHSTLVKFDFTMHDSDHLQCRHLFPATVDRTSVNAWLYKHQWIICQRNKPRHLMTHVACESKLRSIVRSSMHRKLGRNRVCGRSLCPACPHTYCRN